jgi:hypothetical protein
MRILLLISVFLASAGQAEVIGQLTDPPHLDVEAGLDIVAAQVEQTGGQLTFSIWTRGDVPTSLPQPDDSVTFLWLVDTDEDPDTGQLSCSPNPFNPRTEIRFLTAVPGRATLAVHDLRGNRVATLVDAILPAGEHAAVWDGRDVRGRAVAAGSYLARLSTPAGASTRKLTLVK